MLFLGNDFNKSKFDLGVRLSKLKNKIDNRIKFTHYYIILYLGHKRYWIGFNRLKRKVKGNLYRIDGKNIYFDGKRLSKQKPK